MSQGFSVSRCLNRHLPQLCQSVRLCSSRLESGSIVIANVCKACGETTEHRYKMSESELVAWNKRELRGKKTG